MFLLVEGQWQWVPKPEVYNFAYIGNPSSLQQP